MKKPFVLNVCIEKFLFHVILHHQGLRLYLKSTWTTVQRFHNVLARFRGLWIQSVTSLHPSRSFALFLPLCKKQRQRIKISFQTSFLHTARTLGPDPQQAVAIKGQSRLFA